MYSDDIPENAMLDAISDFENFDGPFERERFPELWALDQVDCSTVSFLTAGCQLAYNRAAKPMWEKVIELYREEPGVFNPEFLVQGVGEDEARDIIESKGFRYRSQDAETWVHNFKMFNEYSGFPEFFHWYDYDAVEIHEKFDEDFKVLGGDKVGPFYLRNIHEQVTELDRIHELPIPVDTHIERLTEEMVGHELTKNEIRETWRDFADEHDTTVLKIDGVLWRCGAEWDEWGKGYLGVAL